MATDLGPLQLTVDLSGIQGMVSALDKLQAKLEAVEAAMRRVTAPKATPTIPTVPPVPPIPTIPPVPAAVPNRLDKLEGSMLGATRRFETAEKKAGRFGTTLNTKVIRNGVLAALVVRRLALGVSLLTIAAGAVNKVLGALMTVVLLPLLPLIVFFIMKLAELIGVFMALPKPIQEVIALLVVVGLAAAFLSPLALAVVALLAGFIALWDGLKAGDPVLVAVGAGLITLGGIILGAQVLGAVTALTAGFATLSTFLTATLVPLLMNPLVLALLAVAATVAFLYLAWRNNWLGMHDIIESQWNAIKAVFDLFLTALGAVWDFMLGFIEGVIGPGGIAAVGVAFDSAFASVRLVVERTWDAIRPIFDAIKSGAEAISGVLKTIDFRAAGRTAGEALRSVIPFLQHGGLVTKPTLAMIGEAGPELVVPLRGLRGGSSIDNSVSVGTMNIQGSQGPALSLSSFHDYRFYQDVGKRAHQTRSFAYG